MREKKEINIQIGERVRHAREQASLTQEQLAEKIEVSPQYVSDLERGVVGISISTLKRLCIALCISSDSIIFTETKNGSAYVIAEKCNTMTTSQLAILNEIIDKVIEAFNMEQDNKE